MKGATEMDDGSWEVDGWKDEERVKVRFVVEKFNGQEWEKSAGALENLSKE
jgi:hypothetical protein